MLKSPRLFYVSEWLPDPVNVAAAGLWHRDTRFLDPLRIEPGDTASPPRLLEMARDRATLDYGSLKMSLALGESMIVDLDVAAGPVRVTLSADFRDIFELRGWTARSRGEVLSPEVAPGRIRLGYRARDGHVLTTTIDFEASLEIQPSRFGATLLIPGPGRFRLEIFPGEPEPPRPSRPEPARIRTDNPGLNRLLDQSMDDLASLQTDFPDGTMPAAGVPWFVAPFGRDVLITAWQTLYLDPHASAGTLRALASLQGRAVDPVTGEEPGKIIHEARYGELARIGEIPHRPYYGSIDSTPLFLLMAAETIAWGATPGLYEELEPAIEAALEWVARWGDADGDGLLEYSFPNTDAIPPLASRHQAWKDSDHSLHHRDGSEPHGPIAPIEPQAYTYRALVSLADLARRRDNASAAARLIAGAEELARRVNEAYWLDDEGWYAQALDGAKRPVASIASNGAQVLLSGLAPPERTRRVTERMFRSDLWSRWGVRTLAVDETAYQPLSYHNGSIWPHDNGIIADGCYATGHPEAGEAIFRAMIALAESSDGTLAELYSGEPGDEAPPPVPGSCRPQAWAAGTLPQILRSSLGLRPAGEALLVSPSLPSFLDRVEIEGMSAAGSTGELLVERDGMGYRIEATGLTVRSVSP